MAKKKGSKKVKQAVVSAKEKGTETTIKEFKLADSYLSLVLGIVVVFVLAFIIIVILRTLHVQKGLSQSMEVKKVHKTVVQKKPTPAAVLGTTDGSAITGTKYQVREGDHLWEIAVRAYGDGFRWADIAQANNLSSPDAITNGMILIIPR